MCFVISAPVGLRPGAGEGAGSDGKVRGVCGDRAGVWRPKHPGLGCVSELSVLPVLFTCGAGNSAASEWGHPPSAPKTLQGSGSR